MEVFKVPSRTIDARVALEDGRELQGRLYVPAAGPDGGPARILDRLNDDDERFIPFAVDAGRGLLLHKRWIRAVRLADPDREIVPGVDDDRAVTVRVTMNGGELLRGRFSYSLPADRGRLIDYLNAAARFLPLRATGEVTLINRDYVVCVAGLDEG